MTHHIKLNRNYADALIQNSKINTFEAVFAVAEAKTIIPAEEGTE